MSLRETFALKVGVPLLLFKERAKSGVTFNPLSSGWRYDPHTLMRRLRQKEPVHYSELMQGWIVTGYDEVVSILKDERFSADRTNIINERFQERMDFESPTFATLRRSMLLVDPPDHTRLRTLVSKAFTPRRIAELRPRIQEVVDSLLEALAERGQMDIMTDLANPLPVIVIAEMLGVPVEERTQLKKWSDDLVTTLDFTDDPRRAAIADQAALEFIDYFRVIIRQRRAEPRDDLISAMVAAEDQGDALSEDEMLAMCVLILVAGHETTTNLIGNGVLSLLQHPDQLRQLIAEPSLIESAVEEMLRYEYPVQSTVRIPLEDVSLGGKILRKGQVTVVMVAAANRDPAQFDHPDTFDITRRPKAGHHVAFGHGIHFCLGAPLARLEGSAAIGSLVTRFRDLALQPGKPDWGPGMILRGLNSLPVTFTPVRFQQREMANAAG